ncbi:MAG: endo-1,4-beta-xylanase [Tepidisphaeraceae bacterium]
MTIARAFGILAGLLLTIAALAAGDLTPDAINARIQKYRTADVTLTVTDSSGRSLANAPVVIRQTAHKFLFGSNIFALKPEDASDSQKGYQKRYTDLLNFGTLPFYWGAYERTEGQTRADRLAAMADWCNAHGIRTKGHPLCWQQVFPAWLNDRSIMDIEKLQIARIAREVATFSGRIDTWDVVNEAVVMPKFTGETTRIPELCDKVGRLELLTQCFNAARKANPKATLLLNDYDTGPQYEKLLRECLDAGLPIDVIGIQCHQHTGVWGGRHTWDICERFAKFGKPLNFTEATITSGKIRNDVRWHGPRHDDWPSTPEDEKRQEQQVVEFYTTLFSHPAVAAITWWDFSDAGAWLGAPAGLIRADMTPKPAYESLLKKIKGDWWTGEVKATTDGAGKVTFHGFLGQYKVEADKTAATCEVLMPGTAEAKATVGR